MLKQVSLVFLTRENNGKKEILLAMKKRGFGQGLWNGAGGKMDPAKDKTIEDAARRETKEEIGVDILNMKKVALIDFFFPKAEQQDWNQQAHIYFSDKWSGEPAESEEMAPQWFCTSELPLRQMWSPDSSWLPKVIAGEKIKGKYVFDGNQQVAEEDLEPAFF